MKLKSEVMEKIYSYDKYLLRFFDATFNLDHFIMEEKLLKLSQN